MTARIAIPRTAWLLAPALIAAASLLPAPATARPAVVELFTSQGCSSCPPADAMLNTLAERDDVIALTYNITYWDYLGWRDTLGRKEHTARQEAYAQYFDDRKYTPQLVIDGTSHLPGSRHKASQEAIAASVEDAADAPDLALSTTKKGVRVMSAPVGKGQAAIWLVQFDTSHAVEITRGENSGETITYSNVVRKITRLADWDMSQPLDLAIARASLLDGDHDGCAIIVQQGDTAGVGPVVTATRIDMSLIN